jgi:hypothetical protein
MGKLILNIFIKFLSDVNDNEQLENLPTIEPTKN